MPVWTIIRNAVLLGIVLSLASCGPIRKKRNDHEEDPATDSGETLKDDEGQDSGGEDGGGEDPACAVDQHDEGLRAIADKILDRSKALFCNSDADCTLVTPPCFGACQIPASKLSRYPDFAASEETKAFCADLEAKGCSSKSTGPKICLNSTKTRCVENRCVGFDDSQPSDDCALLQNRMRFAFPADDIRRDLSENACETDKDCVLVTGPTDVLCGLDPSYTVPVAFRTDAFEEEITALTAKIETACLESGLFDPKKDCVERTGTPKPRCHQTKKVCTTVWD